ncbi:hypothetical protein BX070DRAFT_222255 [Coemansia spiralis]|nr:hypothetical protein BX070DRAFT_222255 [Coemansia spiralis]
MVSGKTIAIAATVTAAVAGLSYVAYFDYKRRHDRKFRRKLRRDRKKAEKTAEDVSNDSPDAINEVALKLLDEAAKEKLPSSPEEKEQFFMAQVSKGETLCAAGPSAYPAAACHFYQALKVYPNPVELVMIYQKTTPSEVFKLVMAMMAQEVRQKQSRYFDVFPPKDKNVQIKDKNKMEEEEDKKKPSAESKGKGLAKGKKSTTNSDSGSDVVVPNRALFSTKDFDAGETIYEEESVVSTLLPRAHNGQFCYHCLKSIPGAEPRAENNAKDATGTDETKAAKEPEEEQETEEKREETESINIVEGNEDKQDEEKNSDGEKNNDEEEDKEPGEIPIESASETKDEAKKSGSDVLECDKCHTAVYCSEKCRQDAYDAYHQFLCTNSTNSSATQFAELIKESHELAPILIAKFFGVLVDREKKKELARTLGSLKGISGTEESEDDEYTTWEHLECMRYLELIPSASDAKILNKLGELMSENVPGLTEFVTGERYTMLKGKLDYNAYAVHSAQEANVPAETEETHVSDTMRDDHSGSPVGVSLYLISSHITHSCDPNVQIVFPDNSAKAAIKTLKHIAKGEELHVSFVDTSLDVATRQKVLKGSYRLTCTCEKCKADLAAAPAATAAAADSNDDKEDKSDMEFKSADVKEDIEEIEINDEGEEEGEKN